MNNEKYKQNLQALTEQIRCILLNKDITQEIKTDNAELGELQGAIHYLDKCLKEANEFLMQLSKGELEIDVPGRYNFLAGGLKELHSGLKHLTWQANMVAGGDYSQKVSFLGDFSKAFNQMITQLADRESELKEKSKAAASINELFIAIMDGLKDWVIVIDKDTNEVIYVNKSAKYFLYDPEEKKQTGEEPCGIIQKLLRRTNESDELEDFEFDCPYNEKTILAKSFLIDWNGRPAYVHYLSDITYRKMAEAQMKSMAYKDELTNLFNRRFCIQSLNKLIDSKSNFCFCMLDLDDLKYANDHFGHIAGDEYINIVAEEMLKSKRSTDIVCRVGGDEFSVIYHDCSSQVVVGKMKEINENLMEMQSEFPMSISYGVVQVDSEDNILPEAVMVMADEKMYAQKHMKSDSENHKKEMLIPFSWTEDLSTGNKKLDNENKEIIDTINSLVLACTFDRGKVEVLHIIDVLKRYVKTHFEHEQQLQIAESYPNYLSHKNMHDKLAEEIEYISGKLKKEGVASLLVENINTKIGTHLIDHIKAEDIDVAKYIASKNE